jgi:hypothetical protein
MVGRPADVRSSEWHVMPIEYQRDDRRRLIRVTMTDPFSFDELLRQADRQWAEDAWEYAVLYDSRGSRHIPPSSEIQQMVDHTRAVGGARLRGPVGVAVPPRPEAVRGGLHLANTAGPRRDIEILLNEAQVESWLLRHAPAVRADQ